jgi:membrane protease YdiL (CAAX protease family)
MMGFDTVSSEAGKLAVRRFSTKTNRLAEHIRLSRGDMVRAWRSIRRFVAKPGRVFKPLGNSNWFIVLIIVLIGVTQLALLWRPVVGIYCDAATLAILTGLALWRENLRQLGIAAAILPVASLVTLSLPQTTAFAETTVYYGVLLVLGLIYRYLFTLDHPLRETHLTPREYAFAIPVMLVIGQVLGIIGYGMLRHHYTFDHTSLPLVAATVVVFAIAEETVFRGLIQQSAAQLTHPLVAGILSAMLFVFASIDNTTALAPLFMLIMGPVLAFTYYKRNNVILTMAINAAAKLAYVGLMAAFVFR